MRVSGFRGAPARANGHKALEPREAASAVESTSPEPVDEQIESLLLSLDEPAQTAGATESHAAGRADRPARKRRSGPWQHRRHFPVSQFDLFFVGTAVVLGFAVGLFTVFLVNG